MGKNCPKLTWIFVTVSQLSATYFLFSKKAFILDLALLRLKGQKGDLHIDLLEHIYKET